MRKKSSTRQSRWALTKTLIFGLLIIILPLIQNDRPYEALQTKEICVASVDSISGRGFSPSRYLITVDGENLQLRGEFSFKELKEKLQPHTIVTVKYYTGRYLLLFKTDYIRELTLNGEELVSYGKNYRNENIISAAVIGVLIISTGVLIYNWDTDFLKKLRKKNKTKKIQKT